MLKKIKDWIGSNLDVYKVESASDVGTGLYRHIWKGRENATQIGTTLNAEIMNNLQNSLVHSINATKTTGSGTDYYICNLEGLTEFGLNNDLKLRINVDTKNTNATTKLRLNNIDYTLLKEYNGTLKQIEAGDFKPNKSYELAYNGNQFVIINITEFGTETDTVLEGKRLAEIIGMEFGGKIQDSGIKTAGKFYYDTVTKFYYECIVNNNLTYNDSSKFRAISNKPISDRVENLYTIETHVIFGHLTQAKVFKIGRLCILSMDSNDAWKGVVAGTVLFNLPEKFRPLHYTVAPLGQLGTTENAGVQLETDGRVIYRGHQSIKGALYFNVVYLAK